MRAKGAGASGEAQPESAAKAESAAGPAQGSSLGFDARLARLEALVSELEHGGLALEPSIERYQEGVGLLRECRELLAGLQRRVEELSQSGASAPYASDPDAARS